jgi:hypothetical protein
MWRQVFKVKDVKGLEVRTAAAAAAAVVEP